MPYRTDAEQTASGTIFAVRTGYASCDMVDAADTNVYSVPATDLLPGDNVVAMRARDFGGDDFLDIHVYTIG